MEFIRRGNGITLSALVITIVLLIILSTIAINMTFGESGLIERAEQAKKMTDEAAIKEQEGMANAVAYINEIIYGSGSSSENPSINEEPAVNEEPIINETEPDTNTVETNIVEPPPVVEIPDAEGNVQFGEIIWSDGQASVSISTSSGYRIEYQKNGTTGSWIDLPTGESIDNLNSGDIIYVRLTDGENAREETSIRITDDIAPEVTVTPGTITSSTIKVEVEAVDNESGMLDTVTYTYYIKKSSEPDTAYVNEGSNTNANYTFTGLEQGTSYDIKVEAGSDKAGNTGEGTLLNQSTLSIPGGETGLEEGAILFGTPTWSSGTASVEVSTNMPEYTIEYQVSTSTPVEESWQEIANNGTVSGINHNETVYARLTDGINHGDYASATITDTTGPEVEIVQGEVTSNSIEVTLNAVDNETGLATTGTYKYYLNEESEAKETSTSNTYTFTGLAGGTSYNIKVEVYDKAGNVGTQTTSISTTEQKVADIVGGDILGDTTTVGDGIGNKVVIPGGFRIAQDSGTSVEDGIVIEDSYGNQFVWIPTGTYQTSEGEKTNKLTRRQWASRGPGTGNQEPVEINDDEVLSGNGSIYYYGAYHYGEGDSRSIAHDTIGAFLNSAKPIAEGGNGGFYIGRYEQGTGNVCKAGINVYDDLTRNEAKTQAEAMYSGKEEIKATSQLISSYAWDTVLNFICQNSEYGYELATTISSDRGNLGTRSLRKTGKYPADCYSNIYDLLGNCREWTTEYSSYKFSNFYYTDVVRGGSYGDQDPYYFHASIRISEMPEDTAAYTAFRVQLYV